MFTVRFLREEFHMLSLCICKYFDSNVTSIIYIGSLGFQRETLGRVERDCGGERGVL